MPSQSPTLNWMLIQGLRTRWKKGNQGLWSNMSESPLLQREKWLYLSRDDAPLQSPLTLPRGGAFREGYYLEKTIRFLDEAKGHWELERQGPEWLPYCKLFLGSSHSLTKKVQAVEATKQYAFRLKTITQQIEEETKNKTKRAAQKTNLLVENKLLGCLVTFLSYFLTHSSSFLLHLPSAFAFTFSNLSKCWPLLLAHSTQIDAGKRIALFEFLKQKWLEFNLLLDMHTDRTTEIDWHAA